MSAALREVMDRAVADEMPRPGLVEAVHARGQRRLRRRRAKVAVAAVAFLLGGAAASGLSPRSDPRPPAYAGPLGDDSTHGDLAGNAAYSSAAHAALRDWLAHAQPSNGEPVGNAKVLWAGTTAAGSASVLQQTVNFRKHRQTARWFLGTGPDGPRVTSSDLLSPHVAAWYVDPDHRVLAVVDNGTSRGISYGWTYTADGQARRRFAPLNFKDGVATLTLSPAVRRDTVQVSNLPFHSFTDIVGIGNVGLSGSSFDAGLRWVNPASKTETVIPVDSRGAPQMRPTAQQLWSDAVKALESHTDQAGTSGQFPTWFVVGTTKKGVTVSVFQRALNSDPARLYALVNGTLRDEGPVRRADPLPVRIHLDDGEGWLVAHYRATLRYRIGAGPWVDVGSSAAFVPERATEVAVNTAPGHQAVVRLSTG